MDMAPTRPSSAAATLDAAQAEEVIQAWQRLRAAYVNGQADLHGWSISFKLRPAERQGDCAAFCAASGHRARSLRELRWALGLCDALSGAASASEATASAAATLDAAQAEEVLQAWHRLRADYVNGQADLHGWRISFKLRPFEGGARLGDCIASCAASGQRARSLRELRRALGLCDDFHGAASASEAKPRGTKRPADDTGPNISIAERLIKRRVKGSGPRARVQFLVRWQGYGEADDTWEDDCNILDRRLVYEFDGGRP